MSEQIDVVIVGGGQAGLAVSYELTQAEVAHVVLEKGRVGQTWRGWWDSFCLMTPNWILQLPGHRYDGDDPDGFMARDEVVAYLERFAAGFGPPLREGVEVTSIGQRSGGGFVLQTSAGQITARTVVLATGAYQRPRRPAGAATLPADLLQIDVEQYRNPAALPTGPVLVVGKKPTHVPRVPACRGCCRAAVEWQRPGCGSGTGGCWASGGRSTQVMRSASASWPDSARSATGLVLGGRGEVCGQHAADRGAARGLADEPA